MCQIFIHFPVCKALRYRVSHSNDRRMPYMPGEQLTRSAALASQVPVSALREMRVARDIRNSLCDHGIWLQPNGKETMDIWEWWLGTWILFFHSVGNVIIPTDFHIFQRGANHQPDISNQPNLMGYNYGQWVQPTHDHGIVMVIYHGIYNQPTMRIAFSHIYIHIFRMFGLMFFPFNGCLDWLGWCNSRFKRFKKQQTWYSHGYKTKHNGEWWDFHQNL